MSELGTKSRHRPISAGAISAYQGLADLIPERVPANLETLIDAGQSDIAIEVDRARRSLSSSLETDPVFSN